MAIIGIEFNVPNLSDGSADSAAATDAQDFTILAAGHQLTGVVSGMAVTQRGAGANMSVDVAGGNIIIAGVKAANAGGNVVIGAAHATFARWDLVMFDGATLGILAGTAKARPVFPAITTGHVSLGAIKIPAGATTIVDAYIIDKRLLLGPGGVAPISGVGAATRVAFWSTAQVLTSDADLTFATDTLSATKVASSSLTSGRIPFASTSGLLVDDADMTFATDTLTATKFATGTSGHYAIGSVAAISDDGTYLTLKDQDAHAVMQLGQDSAPTSYYNNTNHTFRTRGAAAVVGAFTGTGTTTLFKVGAGTPAIASLAGIQVVNAANTYLTISDTTISAILGAESTGVILGSMSNHKVDIRTNNTLRATFTAGGNLDITNYVGIGVAASAGEKLQLLADGTTGASGVLTIKRSDLAIKTHLNYSTNGDNYIRAGAAGGTTFIHDANTGPVKLGSSGDIVTGTAARATNVTTGFLYIPTCAGVPSGTPTGFTGQVALIFDTTNNDLYIYNTAWKRFIEG